MNRLGNCVVVLASFVATTSVFALAPRGGGEPPAPIMTPIQVSGWNRDVVVERTTLPGTYRSAAAPFDLFYEYAFYEAGLMFSAKGLPQGGAFVSLTDGTTQVQLQPYDALNSLFLDENEPTGALTFEPGDQVKYDRLSVFAASALTLSDTVGPMTITFVDDTFVELTYNAYDWYHIVSDNAIIDLGRVRLQGGFEDNSSGNPRIYQTTFDLAALGLNDRPVKSLTFGLAVYTYPLRSTCIFAVSGAEAQVAGDLNCDGALTPEDVSAFALALVDPDAYDASYPSCGALRADLTHDGVADGADIQVFMTLLLQQ
ncbi:MAG: hypothetical protein KDA33_08875 [Phycisphaerales bacterium]|nr:hypothetical protein [Phycisphaerales bacterium]